VGALHKLKYLNLNENQEFSEWPQDAEKWLYLQELHIQNTKLPFLPDAVHSWKHLRELHLRNNTQMETLTGP
jgi:hypothetical protein